MYRAPLNQQYSISVSGGAPNISWYFSGGLDKNIGSLYENYRRVNLRTDNTFTIFKGAQVRTGLAYTNSTTEGGRTAYGSISGPSFSMPQYTRLFDDNGSAIPLYKDYRKVYLDTTGAGLLMDWKYYPGTDYKNLSVQNNLQDFLGNIALSYKVGDFTFDGRYQYESQVTDGKSVSNAQSYSARNFINFYSQVNRTTKTVKYAVPVGGILDQSNGKLINHSARAQLGYSKRWSDHNIAAILGTELRQTKVNRSNFRTYGYDDEILTSIPTDFVNPYPTYVTGATGYIPNNSGFARTTDRFVSQFANASYSYKERYTISASARRDASNLFGLNTNDKWTPLWSAGLAWNTSKEDFYKLDLLPLLKIRGTFGYQGNVDQSRAAITTITYTGLTSKYTQQPTTNFMTFYNPELKWEKVGTYNLGIDFGFKNNFLSGSVEFYQKNAKDLYSSVEIDQTLGLGRSELPKMSLHCVPKD
ncbi:TonB-dependent receptor [Chitinophaga sedimenti]|uniref:TonB-dependent receptor domain-containing protein n=1 Tax=Chitinophaga sedimenti TaxID=2033606 RepID=UPI0020048DED|nr:TonB-dependent receptor [Chitinophaga sedimenti]MCK7559352.1 TonB-dependent receptor [Chitinophaga sedimenti]